MAPSSNIGTPDRATTLPADAARDRADERHFARRHRCRDDRDGRPRAGDRRPGADDPLSARISRKAALGARRPRSDAEVEDELTRLHAAAVEEFLARVIPTTTVDIVGFHGHTILHRPAERRTWQIGDGALLAQPARPRRGRRFPLRRRRRGRRGSAAGSAVPRRSCREAAKAARRPQHRRRRECHLDRRGCAKSSPSTPGPAMR